MPERCQMHQHRTAWPAPGTLVFRKALGVQWCQQARWLRIQPGSLWRADPADNAHGPGGMDGMRQLRGAFGHLLNRKKEEGLSCFPIIFTTSQLPSLSLGSEHGVSVGRDVVCPSRHRFVGRSICPPTWAWSLWLNLPSQDQTELKPPTINSAPHPHCGHRTYEHSPCELNRTQRLY